MTLLDKQRLTDCNLFADHRLSGLLHRAQQLQIFRNLAVVDCVTKTLDCSKNCNATCRSLPYKAVVRMTSLSVLE